MKDTHTRINNADMVGPQPTVRAATLEELYMSHPHPAEDSWVGSLATVALALVATAAFLEGIGYNWWPF